MKNINESGRSMVEMLGVLAIIGVLSIGGIAGYTMAMNRYRANEVIDAASKMAIIAMSSNKAIASLDAAALPAAPGGTTCTLSVEAGDESIGKVTIGTCDDANLLKAIESIAGNKYKTKTLRFDGLANT